MSGEENKTVSQLGTFDRLMLSWVQNLASESDPPLSIVWNAAQVIPALERKEWLAKFPETSALYPKLKTVATCVYNTLKDEQEATGSVTIKSWTTELSGHTGAVMFRFQVNNQVGGIGFDPV